MSMHKPLLLRVSDDTPNSFTSQSSECSKKPIYYSLIQSLHKILKFNFLDKNFLKTF